VGVMAFQADEEQSWNQNQPPADPE
jgi:hypothetical protein